MPDLMTRHAPNGMVVSVDHLASQAGAAMLRRGGSAADAAIAANAVLAVTTPQMCGLGGDLFALVHDSGVPGAPAALNASGRAGSGADPEQLRREGHAVMPPKGDIRTVTMPGCVDGWLALHDRYGRLPLADIVEPARTYAADGFPVSPLLASAVAGLGDAVAGADDFLGIGPLHHGRRMHRPGTARALTAIASEGRTGFYRGEFGEGLLGQAADYFIEADLEHSNAEWVEPLTVRAFHHDVWTIPPNSQGYLTLLSLAIAEGLDVPEDAGDPLWTHLLIESARLAGHDRPARLHERADVRGLLRPKEVSDRRARIDPRRRASVDSLAQLGGTIALGAIDSDGMGVSLIQSNASGFGSHIFEPRTGINLQNRGVGFSLERGHPAEYRPGARPPHTLAPALVTNTDGALRAVLGTMGGDAQPQILLQLLIRLLSRSEEPGQAIAAPRWVLSRQVSTGFNTWDAPDQIAVQLEPAVPADWVAGLTERGHRVHVSDGEHSFGHAHVIEVTGDRDRMLAGAADPRTGIGAAAGY